MHKCPICSKMNSKNIYKQSNQKLARYGFLKDKNLEINNNNLNLDIQYCESCVFAWNSDFDYHKIKYDSDSIIEAGYFSKNYIDYQKKSARELNEAIGHDLRLAVEIGAGAGIFINELNALRKIAIEPSSESKQIPDDIEVFNQYYTENEFNYSADVVILRQVLEHIPNPVGFLNSIKKSFFKKELFYIYLEVPNSTITFNKFRFYDYYYEHCNYFSIRSIVELADEIGMGICSISTEMRGEIISVLLTGKKFQADLIANGLAAQRDALRKKIDNYVADNKKIIAWGASGNGVEILNTLNISTKKIPLVIDSDKNKQGLYIPGTHQKIISPLDALEYRPDVIMVFTQFHKKEIEKTALEIFGDVIIEFAE